MQPVMNNTKWDELRLAMHSINPKPQWSTLSDNEYSSKPEPGWYYHFREGRYKDIVYVDIYAKGPSHRDLIRAALQLIHLLGEETDFGFRVFGYIEPGQEVSYI